MLFFAAMGLLCGHGLKYNDHGHSQVTMGTRRTMGYETMGTGTGHGNNGLYETMGTATMGTWHWAETMGTTPWAQAVLGTRPWAEALGTATVPWDGHETTGTVNNGTMGTGPWARDHGTMR